MKCPVIDKNSIVQGNSAELLKCLPDDSVDLIVTSPPYAKMRKDHYNSIDPSGYVDWFMPFAIEMKRVLKPTGSFVLNMKENVVNGSRHPYVFKTLISLVDDGWNWNETYLWNKRNPVPRNPSKRFKDGFEYLFHLTKTPDFKFYPKRAMIDGKKYKCKRYEREKKVKEWDERKWKTHSFNWKKLADYGCDKVYPTNVLDVPVGGGKTHHPARFPRGIPEFFVNVMSDEGDVVLDPFAGGGTTNMVSRKACRDTIGFELDGKFAKIAGDRLKKTRCEKNE